MNAPTLRARGFEGSALRVDTGSGAVIGRWVAIPDEAEPRLDFQTPAELCRCCGRILLLSGSKFSIWFCDECKERVRALNSASGRCVIPLGRHTFCNGIGTESPRLWKHGDVERFVNNCRGLWESMGVLDRWADEVVHRNCVALGLDTRPTVLLSSYLVAVKVSGIRKPEAFTQMLDWWASQ
jgi:hypothetical protein